MTRVIEIISAVLIFFGSAFSLQAKIPTTDLYGSIFGSSHGSQPSFNIGILKHDFIAPSVPGNTIGKPSLLLFAATGNSVREKCKNNIRAKGNEVTEKGIKKCIAKKREKCTEKLIAKGKSPNFKAVDKCMAKSK